VATYNLITDTTANYTVYTRRSSTPIPDGWAPCVSTLGHYQLRYKTDQYESTNNRVIRDDYNDFITSTMYQDTVYVTKNASGATTFYRSEIRARIPQVKLCTLRYSRAFSTNQAFYDNPTYYSPVSCDFIASDDTTQVVDTMAQQDNVWLGNQYRWVAKDPAEPVIQVNGTTLPTTTYPLKTEVGGGEYDQSSTDCYLDDNGGANYLNNLNAAAFDPIALGKRVDGKYYYRVFMLLKKK